MEPLPERCPRCERAFSTLIKPQSKMRKKAVSLFLLGVAVTFPWALGVVVAVSFSPIAIIPRSGPIVLALAVIALAILLAPGLIIGRLAMMMTPVTAMKCSRCGWSEKFYRKRDGQLIRILI
jgi:hypothetical protein